MTIIINNKQYTVLDNGDILIVTPLCAMPERVKSDNALYPILMDMIERTQNNDDHTRR